MVKKDSPLAPRPRPVHGKVERAAYGARSDVRAALSLAPAKLHAHFEVVVKAAGGVPTGALSPQDKARLRPLEGSTRLSGLTRMASLLENSGAVLGPGLPKPDEVTALKASLTAYEKLRAQAARGAQLCASLRGLLSAYAWFNVTAAIKLAREKIADPQTPREEAELYRDRLAVVLLHKEAVLRAQAEGRAAAKDARERDAEEEERQRKEAVVLDVTTAIKNNWPVDRASLVEAARYSQELRDKK